MVAMGEAEEFPFVLMPTVPAMKYHDEPLHFMSQPGLTQKEYEQTLFAAK